MKLLRDWQAIVCRAWSVRLWLLAFACGAADIVLSVLGQINHDTGWSIALQMAGLVFSMAGLIARVVAQRNLPRE